MEKKFRKYKKLGKIMEKSETNSFQFACDYFHTFEI